MKFTSIAAIFALAPARASTAAADHHGEGDVDVDATGVMIMSHHADSEAVLSNVQDVRRALEGSKSFKQPKPKRIREKVAKSSKQQPKSSKADAESISKAERELCIWDKNPSFDLSSIKEAVGAVIESVNVAKLTLTDPTVFVVVPNGALTNLPERVTMISEMASELGVDESTFTFVEQQDLEVPAVGDVVVVYLTTVCGGVPKIEVYEDGEWKFDQGLVLKSDNDECEWKMTGTSDECPATSRTAISELKGTVAIIVAPKKMKMMMMSMDKLLVIEHLHHSHSFPVNSSFILLNSKLNSVSSGSKRHSTTSVECANDSVIDRANVFGLSTARI